MAEDPDLTALLGSRICHDLISPLGAIGNGVELIQLEGGRGGPEMALISESVNHASARLRFFRMAFGAASAQQRTGRPEIVSILVDITRGGRLTVDWRPPGDQLRREVKLAFLALLCFETAMPWGGAVEFDRDGPGWRARARSPRFRREPALWEAVAAGETPANITPAHVHFALFGRELARQKRRLEVAREDGGIGLSF